LKGLVIDDPWIKLILAGTKTWEMRSTATSYRGRVALIRKGTGHIFGVCDLAESLGPLDAIAWRAHRGAHAIPVRQDSAVERWPYAWVLRSVRVFRRPISYLHPRGAVIWVCLSPEVVEACRAATFEDSADGSSITSDAAPSALMPVTSSAILRTMPSALPPKAIGSLDGRYVPVAKDGTWFGPHLRKAAGFTVGCKGKERKVKDFLGALDAMRQMPRPHWRRPNPLGHWGIIVGVRWLPLQEEYLHPVL